MSGVSAAGAEKVAVKLAFVRPLEQCHTRSKLSAAANQQLLCRPISSLLDLSSPLLLHTMLPTRMPAASDMSIL